MTQEEYENTDDYPLNGDLDTLDKDCIMEVIKYDKELHGEGV
jgi:hypothetical protein